jgi:hypothetical protein
VLSVLRADVSGVELAQVTRAVGADPKHDLLFLSGSLVAGFGNPRSDLDLFVVTGSLAEAAARATQAFSRFLGSERTVVLVQDASFARQWDVEVWTRSGVDGLRAKWFGTGDPMKSLDSAWGLTEADFDFVHRLSIAQPVNSPAGLADLQARFDFGRLPSLLCARRTANYESRATDALGAIEGGQLETAHYSARMALEFALDAYLAALGETYVAPKWMHEKAKRTCPNDPLYLAFRELERQPPATADDYALWVERALHLAQRLAFAAAEHLDT